VTSQTNFQNMPRSRSNSPRRVGYAKGQKFTFKLDVEFRGTRLSGCDELVDVEKVRDRVRVLVEERERLIEENEKRRLDSVQKLVKELIPSASGCKFQMEGSLFEQSEPENDYYCDPYLAGRLWMECSILFPEPEDSSDDGSFAGIVISCNAIPCDGCTPDRFEFFMKPEVTIEVVGVVTMPMSREEFSLFLKSFWPAALGSTHTRLLKEYLDLAEAEVDFVGFEPASVS
jgi:hypothetical protein